MGTPVECLGIQIDIIDLLLMDIARIELIRMDQLSRIDVARRRKAERTVPDGAFVARGIHRIVQRALTIGQRADTGRGFKGIVVLDSRDGQG